LMQSLTGSQKQDPLVFDQAKKDYENDLKNLLDKIDNSIDNRIKDWENSKLNLNQENSHLKNEIENLNKEKKNI